MSFFQFGTIAPPPGVNRFAGGNVAGVPMLINIILLTLITGAGLYAIFNFIIAGYKFIFAGGDAKRVEDAWARIWQTIIGLIIVAGVFVIAGIVGRLIFGDPYALLQLRIYTP